MEFFDRENVYSNNDDNDENENSDKKRKNDKNEKNEITKKKIKIDFNKFENNDNFKMKFFHLETMEKEELLEWKEYVDNKNCNHLFPQNLQFCFENKKLIKIQINENLILKDNLKISLNHL